MEFSNVVIAGWTGRDEAQLKKHIMELAEIGVKPPKTTPIFYRVSSSLITYSKDIQVSGGETSGLPRKLPAPSCDFRSAVTFARSPESPPQASFKYASRSDSGRCCRNSKRRMPLRSRRHLAVSCS